MTAGENVQLFYLGLGEGLKNEKYVMNETWNNP